MWAFQDTLQTAYDDEGQPRMGREWGDDSNKYAQKSISKKVYD